jgi:hypothetical protein
MEPVLHNAPPLARRPLGLGEDQARSLIARMM